MLLKEHSLTRNGSHEFFNEFSRKLTRLAIPQGRQKWKRKTTSA